MASANQKDVFVIRKVGSKTYWNKAGQAFVNRDGSVNVRLDLFPNVDLQIRDLSTKKHPKGTPHEPDPYNE
jgi:hypothetical protein